jgi:hypothetical protein
VTEDEVQKFGAKIVRGLACKASGSCIDATYDIDVPVIDDDKAPPISDLVNHHSIIFDLRPGNLIRQSLAEYETVAGIYFIEIWGRFRMYVIVKPRGLSVDSSSTSPPST